MNTYRVPWEEFAQNTHDLCDQLIKGSRPTYDQIVAVTRGGLVPAAIIARRLEIRVIDTMCLGSYRDDTTQQEAYYLFKDIKITSGPRTLIVDDLVDTGKTAQVILKKYPAATYAVVYAKPLGKKHTHFYSRLFPQNTWIEFPWEVDANVSFTE